MPSNQELLKRITARSDVFGGKPIIRDGCWSNQPSQSGTCIARHDNDKRR